MIWHPYRFQFHILILKTGVRISYYMHSFMNYKILFVVTSYEPDLQFVRIHFDTPTFDRITKDRKAKFVDKLSAIGGTMGLLTGFSIISGVEIIYFAFKLVKHYLMRIR